MLQVKVHGLTIGVFAINQEGNICLQYSDANPGKDSGLYKFVVV